MKKPRDGGSRGLRGGIFGSAADLGDRHFGRLDQGDDFAADLQVQVMDRARGDHRGDDAVLGLHIDFGDYRSKDDFLDLAAELVTYVNFRNGHRASFVWLITTVPDYGHSGHLQTNRSVYPYLLLI